MHVEGAPVAIKDAVARMRICAALAAILGVAAFHVLTLHLVLAMPAPLVWLLGLLAAIWLLVWATSQSARHIPSAERSSFARLCAGFDREGAALLGLLFALVIAFYFGYTRASGDGRDYFAQLRSALMDFDFDFRNEIAEFGGREPQTFPIGSGILWTPFFLACHWWLAFLNLFEPGIMRNGYWNPYQMAVGLGSLCYGFLGLVLAYRIARDYFSFPVAFLSVTAIATGSFLIYYLTIEGTYSHANSFFAVTLFVFLWIRTRDDVSLRRWVVLGAAGGLMMMVRWQNAVFFMLPYLDSAPAYLTKERGRLLVSHGLCALTAFVVFVPQLAAWKIMNGGWLAVPNGQAGQQWWHDSLALDILFSSNHGLFAWHPLLYVAVLGFPLFFRREPRLTALLVVAFLAQAYVNGANATWYGGSAFGGRRFDGCLVLFVLGLASLVHAVQRKPMALVVPTVAAAVLFNIVLMLDVLGGPLESGQGATFAEMFNSVYARTGNPFSFPENVRFAWKYDTSLAQYDRSSKQWYTNVKIDVGGNDEAFLGGGWAAPERDRETSFRWAIGLRSFVVAPIRSEIRLAPGEPMRIRDYRLKFRAQPFAPANMPEPWVEVLINDVFVARQALKFEWSDYEIPIPSRLLRRNLNGVEFRYAYAISPADAGLSADSRTLAVRFDAIEFIRQGDVP